MRPLLLCLGALVLPLASAFITYTFVSAGSNPITLDATQSAIVCLALIKMLLLGSTGIFPIDLDDMFRRVWSPFEREKRDLRNTIYKTPDVKHMPCLRRLLCEVETAARTSDQYGQQAVSDVNDRRPEEEVDIDMPDPITELHEEAIRAMFGHNNPDSPDSTPGTRKALEVLNSLTGESCEAAYKLCPGRYTAPMVFRSIFEEIGYKAKDEL